MFVASTINEYLIKSQRNNETGGTPTYYINYKPRSFVMFSANIPELLNVITNLKQ